MSRIDYHHYNCMICGEVVFGSESQIAEHKEICRNQFLVRVDFAPDIKVETRHDNNNNMLAKTIWYKKEKCPNLGCGLHLTASGMCPRCDEPLYPIY